MKYTIKFNLWMDCEKEATEKEIADTLYDLLDSCAMDVSDVELVKVTKDGD
jgi:hypothetical protein